ncbi:MAG: polysaccharide deacetylase [Lachnospiraceae bacterium]|jgi:peptidoglycan/xylan/chitin deacetylase (PgdA/CDA1 family)|nr:polysaccharide deacetylase [Lachnospiraceae bacterium]MDD6147656.1 polysaccharide deacetylase [Lachnospiraceae bacterium]MDY5704960.1 polysaccharide deacetylase family protein [Lachnospiraceae bacterium]
MNEANELDLERYRNKRKRVKKMKSGIMGFLLIWVLISTIVMSFLVYKVYSLQKQMNSILNGTKTTSLSSSSVKNIDSRLVQGNSGADEENLRAPDDVLKVYLTFDDGPSNNSNQILDILDDYNVKATFFVNGREDENSLAVYKRIADEGHSIGMHSYSHKYKDLYKSLDSFIEDTNRIHQLILDTTGQDCKLYRFPGGSSNQVSDTDMSQYIAYLNDNHIRYMDWNVSSGDASSSQYTADDVIENVMKDVVRYKTSVVLMHDANTKNATVEALPRLIERLRAEGAIILPITDETKLIQHVTLDK